VAQGLGWTERGAEILLNALVALGYLEKNYRNYQISPYYQDVFTEENYPFLKQRLIHHWRLMRHWQQLDKVLKSGIPIKEELKKEREENIRNFILAMAQGEKLNLPILLNKVSLEGCTHLLDVGGGPGLFSIGFVEKYPELQATVFDRPEVEAIARKFFQKSSAKNRLHFRGGNFLFDDLGRGYDVALLSSILHIYSPEENISLLKKVYDALKERGKIIIREFFLDRTKTRPVDSALFAVNMLVNTERGNAYSTEEIRNWLKIAGFRKSRRICLRGPVGLMEAFK